MRIIKTYGELWRGFLTGIESLVRGFCRIGWVIMLLPVNTAVSGFRAFRRGVEARPLAAALLIGVVMLAANMMTYAYMRCEVENARYRAGRMAWQVDSIRDSLGVKGASRTLPMTARDWASLDSARYE